MQKLGKLARLSWLLAPLSLVPLWTIQGCSGGNDTPGGGSGTPGGGSGTSGGGSGASGAGNGADQCPDDPGKTTPGECGCGQAEGSCGAGACQGQDAQTPACQGAADTAIGKVYLAQTHVLTPDDPNFKLVAGLNALVKVDVVSASGGQAPPVRTTLRRGAEVLELTLTGPSTLPTSLPSGPGVVQHRHEDSFTGLIPAAWVQPGLSMLVKAGAASVEVKPLKVGAPNRLVMTMIDLHYFKLTPGDYPAGWKEELEAKLPVSQIDLRRTQDIVFSQLVIPPRASLPAVRISSTQDYQDQTGSKFDGEQLAAKQWNGALKVAAGTAGRISLHYFNIHGVPGGGEAGGFSGVGNVGNVGILLHELGHALSLPHWGDNEKYPYKGDMFGIKAPDSYKATHAGPTWAYDLRSGQLMPPTVQPGAAKGTPGTYKQDPMQGGGTGDQEPPLLFRHFSDYSVSRMRDFLEQYIVTWNEALGSYASWDDAQGGYTKVVPNDGVKFAIERDVSVLSVMVAVSAVTPAVTMVYPPIGPYVSGLIRRFDPTVPADRESAASLYCPKEGCDVSLRVVQGGKEKVYMLPIAWDPGADPLAVASLITKAINLPAADGAVTSLEILATPEAQQDGLPASPAVLGVWKP